MAEGVMATIIQELRKGDEWNPVTKKEILQTLCDKFPDRERDKMEVTMVDTIHRQAGKLGWDVHVKKWNGEIGYYITNNDGRMPSARPGNSRGPNRVPREEYLTQEGSVTGVLESTNGTATHSEVATEIQELRQELRREEDRSANLAIKLRESEEEFSKIAHNLLVAFNHMKDQLEETKKLASASVRRVEIKVGKAPPVTLEERHHAQLEYVLKLVNTHPDPRNKDVRMNVILIGPAGSGKTVLAEQVADVMELPFSFMSCSAGMSEGQLLGRLIPTEQTPKDVAKRFKKLVEAGMPEQAAALASTTAGAFRYVESEFVKSYEQGGVFLLDEVDNMDPNTAVIINTGIAGSRLAIPNRPHKPYAERHPDFILIAAANTFGSGADRMYVGRNQQDEAFLDRWRGGQVIVDYDPILELELCPSERLRKRLQAYRENCTKNRLRRIISSRFLRDAYAMLRAGVTHQDIDKALFGGWKTDEIEKAREGVNWKEEEEEVNPVVEEEEEKGEKPPVCPHHPDSTMVRMKTGKGWRCGVDGNRYRSRGGRAMWTICNHAVWDSNRSK